MGKNIHTHPSEVLNVGHSKYYKIIAEKIPDILLVSLNFNFNLTSYFSRILLCTINLETKLT